MREPAIPRQAPPRIPTIDHQTGPVMGSVGAPVALAAPPASRRRGGTIVAVICILLLLPLAAGAMTVMMLHDGDGTGSASAPAVTSPAADSSSTAHGSAADGRTDHVGGNRIEGGEFGYPVPAGWHDQSALHAQYQTATGTEVLQVLASSPDPARTAREGSVAVMRTPADPSVSLENSGDEFIAG